MSHAGVEIRTRIKTKPAEQWALAREFRLRGKDRPGGKGYRLWFARSGTCCGTKIVGRWRVENLGSLG